MTGAIQRQPAGTRAAQVKDAMIPRRGNQAHSITQTTASWILQTQVFYALHDGHAQSATLPAA